MKAGATDFIEKPFNDELLLDSIRNALLLDGSQRVDEVIGRAIPWDVMGGVARRPGYAIRTPSKPVSTITSRERAAIISPALHPG